jgi:hypothetical protein
MESESESEPEFGLESEPESKQESEPDLNIIFIEVMYLSGDKVGVVEFDPNDCVGKLASSLELDSIKYTKYGLQQVTHLDENGVKKLKTTKLLPQDHIIRVVPEDTYELYIVFLTEHLDMYLSNYWAMSWLYAHDSNRVRDDLLCRYSRSYVYDIPEYLCDRYKRYGEGVEMIKLLISIGYYKIHVHYLLYMKFDKKYIYENKHNLLTNGLIAYLAKNDPDIEFASLFKDISSEFKQMKDKTYVCCNPSNTWIKNGGYGNQFERAIKYGNFEFARWISSVVNIPGRAKYSMMDIVRFSINNPKFDNFHDWIEFAKKFRFGNVIKYIIKHEKQLRYPALELIILLISKGCPITEADMDCAILYNPNIAAYLGDNRYSLGSNPINYYIATNNWDMVEAGTAKIKYPITAQHFNISGPYHPMRIIATLPRQYNIELAKKVLELGCTWGSCGLTTLARKYGNDDFAKWARENGCEIGPARARR